MSIANTNESNFHISNRNSTILGELCNICGNYCLISHLKKNKNTKQGKKTLAQALTNRHPAPVHTQLLF